MPCFKSQHDGLTPARLNDFEERGLLTMLRAWREWSSMSRPEILHVRRNDILRAEFWLSRRLEEFFAAGTRRDKDEETVDQSLAELTEVLPELSGVQFDYIEGLIAVGRAVRAALAQTSESG